MTAAHVHGYRAGYLDSLTEAYPSTGAGKAKAQLPDKNLLDDASVMLSRAEGVLFILAEQAPERSYENAVYAAMDQVERAREQVESYMMQLQSLPQAVAHG